METFDIPLGRNYDPTALPELIERAVAQDGLLASRLELRSYPGAIHWHLKQPGAKGTLELTYWPQTSRLWFAVHANRRGDWILPAIERLTARIVQSLPRSVDLSSL